MYNPATADAEATPLQVMPRAEQLFKLGMMCSTGQSMPLDMVSAHKWFNIAAMRGMKDAVRLRNERGGDVRPRDRYGATRRPSLVDAALSINPERQPTRDG